MAGNWGWVQMGWPMILGLVGILMGEGSLGRDLIRKRDWPVVLGGSWYLWARALEVTRVAGLLSGGGRGCGAVTGGSKISIPWDKTTSSCLA